MPVRRLAVIALVAAGCGGCSGGDGSSPDAAPPPEAEVVFQEVVFDDYSGDIAGAVMLETGIAILAPPRILLVDKEDGTLLAEAPWPTGAFEEEAWLEGAMRRASGNLVLLVGIAVPDEGDHIVTYEYAADDLSLVDESVVTDKGGQEALAELSGALHVVQYDGTPKELVHYRVSGSGEVESQLVNDGYTVPGGGLALGTADGRVLFCAQSGSQGPAAAMRVDPDTGDWDALPFPGETSSVCSLVPGEDSVLARWRDNDGNARWEILSPDGTEVLARHPAIDDPRTYDDAYVDGQYVTVKHTTDGLKLWAVDAGSGALRGPILVPGTAATVIWIPALASDGDRLYAVYASSPGVGNGTIRLAQVNLPPP